MYAQFLDKHLFTFLADMQVSQALGHFCCSLMLKDISWDILHNNIPHQTRKIIEALKISNKKNTKTTALHRPWGGIVVLVFAKSDGKRNAASLITTILCYLSHIDTIEYNNDLKNHAVCRGNQHCLNYALNLGKHNISRGFDTTAHAIQGKPSTYPPRQTLGSQKKTSPRLAQEIWVGTKVGHGCQALLLGS